MRDPVLYLYILGTVVIAASLFFFKKYYSQKKAEEIDQTLLGIAIGFVATIFSFILGFVVVNLWENYGEAEKITFVEATELRTVYRLAEGISHGDVLQNHIRSYVKAVVEEEWKMMAQEQISLKADQAKNKLWDAALKVARSNKGEEVLTEKMMDAVIKFNDARRSRLDFLGSSLHPLLTYSLILTALFTLVCFSFVAVRSSRLHIVLDLFLVFCVMFNFYLVHAIDRPFSGDGICVSAHAFEHLLSQVSIK